MHEGASYPQNAANLRVTEYVTKPYIHLKSSTIQGLPTEILCEIFLHCLPPDPLHHPQPDTTIAPMLLCQVCAHWRAVSLSCMELWIQLYYIMHVFISRKKKKKINRRRVKILSADIQFLHWWQGKLRSSPPILRLGVVLLSGYEKARTDGRKDAFEFINQLVSSAQYLDIPQDVVKVLHEYLSGSCSQLNPHNIDTFVLRCDFHGNIPLPDDIRRRDLEHTLLPFLFSNSHPIRRLILGDLSIGQNYIPHLQCTQLTHLVIIGMIIDITTWFDLIRQCVNLQDGTFGMKGEESWTQPGVTAPAFCTLPRLRRLFICSYLPDCDQKIFLHLGFPNLTTLCLQTSMTGFELHTALSAAPFLKELHLGFRVLNSNNPVQLHKFIFDDLNIQPLSTQIPLLKHLVLHIGIRPFYYFEQLDHWLESVLKSKWLQLGEPNFIEKVEFIVTSSHFTTSGRTLVSNVLESRAVKGVELTVTWDDHSTETGQLADGEVHQVFEDVRCKLATH